MIHINIHNRKRENRIQLHSGLAKKVKKMVENGQKMAENGKTGLFYAKNVQKRHNLTRGRLKFKFFQGFKGKNISGGKTPKKVFQGRGQTLRKP